MVRFPTGFSPRFPVRRPRRPPTHAPPSSMAVPRFTDCNLMIVVAYAALALSEPRLANLLVILAGSGAALRSPRRRTVS